MTFALISTENNRSSIIGTIWAMYEQEAQLIAGDLCRIRGDIASFKLTPIDEREMPLNLRTVLEN